MNYYLCIDDDFGISIVEENFNGDKRLISNKIYSRGDDFYKNYDLMSRELLILLKHITIHKN